MHLTLLSADINFDMVAEGSLDVTEIFMGLVQDQLIFGQFWGAEFNFGH